MAAVVRLQASVEHDVPLPCRTLGLHARPPEIVTSPRASIHAALSLVLSND